METVKNKVAVVTGAGSGIGEAIAREAAARGMSVVVADIDEAAAERVVVDDQRHRHWLLCAHVWHTRVVQSETGMSSALPPDLASRLPSSPPH